MDDEFAKMSPSLRSRKLDAIEHLQQYGKSEFIFTIVHESYTLIFRVGNFHSFLGYMKCMIVLLEVFFFFCSFAVLLVLQDCGFNEVLW